MTNFEIDLESLETEFSKSLTPLIALSSAIDRTNEIVNSSKNKLNCEVVTMGSYNIAYEAFNGMLDKYSISTSIYYHTESETDPRIMLNELVVHMEGFISGAKEAAVKLIEKLKEIIKKIITNIKAMQFKYRNEFDVLNLRTRKIMDKIRETTKAPTITIDDITMSKLNDYFASLISDSDSLRKLSDPAKIVLQNNNFIIKGLEKVFNDFSAYDMRKPFVKMEEFYFQMHLVYARLYGSPIAYNWDSRVIINVNNITNSRGDGDETIKYVSRHFKQTPPDVKDRMDKDVTLDTLVFESRVNDTLDTLRKSLHNENILEKMSKSIDKIFDELKLNDTKPGESNFYSNYLYIAQYLTELIGKLCIFNKINIETHVKLINRVLDAMSRIAKAD